MNISPTSSSGSTSSTPSSSASNSTLQPSHGLSPTLRRRSVDTGGLSLAINDHEGSGSGRGYGGWVDQSEALPGSIDVAQLVIAMRHQTHSVIDQAFPATSPSFHPSETDAFRETYIRKLATWHFDASHAPPDELLACTILLFELLWTIEGMEEDIGLAFDTIPPFLARISKIYRKQTSYHNFQHALDVLQAVYCYLYEAGCIPSIEILLDSEQSAKPLSLQFESGQANLPVPTDVGIPPPRRHKSWRRPRPRTLLQRALRNQDLFALFVAGIGHDIGHPGVSNAFLTNAKTPLAELFDDTSVLEKLHCTLLLQVMRKHSMGHLLDRLPSILTNDAGFSSVSQSRARTESDPGVLNHDIRAVFPAQNGNDTELPRPLTPQTLSPLRPILKKSVSVSHGPFESTTKGTETDFRNLLAKTILSTDMSVHFQWMPKFEKLREDLDSYAESEDASNLGKATDDVDSQTRLLLCQALIKCADISNPSRPPPACKHWSWSLLTEWTEQALLEAHLSLPISVNASEDPLVEAQGQINFINMFTQPLLDLTSSIIPEMAVFGKQSEANVAMWQAKIKELNARAAVPPPSLTPLTSSSNMSSLALPTSPPDVSTMFALSLPAALYTPSSPSRHTPWPLSDILTSPLAIPTRSEISDVVGVNGRLNGPPCSLGSIPPSPASVKEAVMLMSHQHHPSHTELPQVSIPVGPSPSFSPSTSQHVKSSSTTASASPLFSPRSITTSSSSPRSSIASSPGPGSATSTLGVQFRPALRAAYDAHGRPKAMKRLENRTSWQGSMNPSSTPGPSNWAAEAIHPALPPEDKGS
ncbi:hypothetical protein JB92DRAFT_1043791 [Gautieria morchelliformis]|nr:hypothetical protein JB92DRAFT_1043791 [Gautieria morchelliformis]